MLALVAAGVSKVYKHSIYAALKNMSLSVNRGEIFTLLGRNGAGKTTFVRICATQLLPSAGTVNILGYDVLKRREKSEKSHCHSASRRSSSKVSYSMGSCL